MSFTKIIGPLAVIIFTIGAWRQFGWPGIAMAVVDHVQRVLFTDVTWLTRLSGTFGSSFSCAVADQTPGPQSQLHGPEGRSGS